MKILTHFYDYLFYTFYRFWESSPLSWWSDMKSVISIGMLKVFVLSGLYSLIMVKTKLDLIPKGREIAIPLIIMLVIFVHDYYIFLHKDKWRNRISKFKDISRLADFIGITIVILLIIGIVSFLSYSYYLLGSVDWTQY
ncbi:hypothetical protein [Carboxylicivirga taeanensis]|uniref:hypothetical protein n=1 Tax=Carboxylicivirga taeanensis TaxID=1416875 RepID=UPI003F6DEB36